ncbi:MAG: hypothetical protein K2M30_01310 [Desulfovibrionaceae bacterium]|nr:hypothetical protein [Desulfovibrionaceae bacterium]
MKRSKYLFIVIGILLSYTSVVYSRDIVEDINSILQIEDVQEQQKQEKKKEGREYKEGRKRILSRYSEDNLPRSGDFVDAFKIAVEVIFGETKEDTAIDEVRNAAYMIQGVSAFVIKGLDYCMNKDYLGEKGREAKEKFLEKNNITLTNVSLIFSKTKPLTDKERFVLDTFTDKALTKEFTSIEACVKHEYQVQRGTFTLSTYDKTKGYVDIINSFLRME